MTKIYKKMPTLASGTTLKSDTSQPIPFPSPHPHLGQMSRRRNVVLYFKTNNLCTRFERKMFYPNLQSLVWRCHVGVLFDLFNLFLI